MLVLARQNGIWLVALEESGTRDELLLRELGPVQRAALERRVRLVD